MPNWCQNTIEISGDLQEITDLMYAMKDRGFCEAVIPLGEWDYGKAVDSWGTKWDLQIEDDCFDVVKNEDGTGTLFIDANSAWAPPIPVIEDLSQKFEVEAWWVEPGMAFCGQYLDGEMTEWEDAGDIDGIPEEDRDLLADDLRSWLEEEKEWNAMNRVDWDSEEGTEDAE
jgi:hypothetical protein